MYTSNINVNSNSHYNFTSNNKRKALKKVGVALCLGAILLNSKPNQTNALSKPKINIDLTNYSPDYFYYYNTREKNPKLIEASKKANSYLDIPLFGKYLNSNKGNEEIKYAAKGSENKINGYIDEDVIQGIAQDCWLLCAANNLSYTPKGAEALHNAIRKNENGDIDVYFKGPNLTYTVTLDELELENEDYTLLSIGDDDMLAFEIAAKKYREDLANNKIEIDENLPGYFYQTASKDDFSPLNMGEIRQGYWLLAGILDSKETKDPKEVRYLFEKFRQAPTESLLDIELEKEAIVDDINGDKIYLRASHGYGVKNITDDTITLISSSNSSHEIVLPIDIIDELSLLGVIYCPV